MKHPCLLSLMTVLMGVAACTQSNVTLHAKRVARFVDAKPPYLGEFEQNIEFTGSVEPRQFVNLNFAVSGRIESCKVSEGARVTKGQELCHLDESVVGLEVKRAQEAYKAAERVNATQFVHKQKKLFEAGVIGQAEFEQLRIQSEGSKATEADAHSVYKLALRKKSEHYLRAPWDGIVVKLLMRPGQLISPEVPVAIVSGHAGLQIKTELPASAFSFINVGNQAKLTSAAVKLSDVDENWSISEKSVSINPATQTFSVVLFADNSNSVSKLAPGMLVSGTVQSQKFSNVLVVPQSSLYTIDAKGQAQLFVVENGRLKLKSIEISAVNGKIAQVAGGLLQSDVVVTRIAPDFNDGMMVEVAQ